LFDFGTQEINVVVKSKLRIWEGNPGSLLWSESEVIPFKPQLAENSGKWSFPRTLGGKVCNGVEADVVVTSIHPVE
jgi:hypothetical protein